MVDNEEPEYDDPNELIVDGSDEEFKCTEGDLESEDEEDCILGSRTRGKNSDIYIQSGPMDCDPKSASVLRIQTSDTLASDLVLLWELEKKKTPESTTSIW